MKKKSIIIVLCVAVLVGGVSFYGGMKYGQNKSSATIQGAGMGFANFSPVERQARFQQSGVTASKGQAGMRTGGGFIAGEIISKDDKSITIKMQDGGSKIVFYSESTEVEKFVSGTAVDLEVGKTVTVNGSANSDGSITAQSIQMRPANSNPSQ